MDLWLILIVPFLILVAPRLTKQVTSLLLRYRSKSEKKALQLEIIEIRKELSKINQVDQFAKFARAERKLRAATDKLNSLSRQDLELNIKFQSQSAGKGQLLRTMKARQVVCTGLGTINPLGSGVEKTWSALLKSKSGITRLKDEHLYEGCQSRVAAYVPDVDLKNELAEPKHSYMVKHAKQLSRATSFAMLAAHQALEGSKLLNETGELHEIFRKRCGVTIGQGMVDFHDIYENGKLLLQSHEGKSGLRRMSPFFMTRALMNMSSGNLSIRYKLNGPNHCVSTACATGAHSIGDAFNFIKKDQADIMLCGSTEASINSLAVAGFERLKALSTKFNDDPTASSRPFDQNRCGFVMGEGAGVLILEEKQHALNRGIKLEDMYCEMLGYGLSADGHHLTAPAPDGLGATLSMQNALRDAGLQLSEVGHINAHATSTPIGDDIECNAIEDLFFSADSQQNRRKSLTITSCKGAIGHLLGGAGSVETIFAILSCRDATIPHCLNLNVQLTTPRNLIQIVTKEPQAWEEKDRFLVKNSFGFGGSNSSLVISNIR